MYLRTTYCGLHSGSCSQYAVLPMLSHPMEFDVERLLGHVLRNESGQELVDDFLGHSGKNVKWRDIENFRPTVWMSALFTSEE